MNFVHVLPVVGLYIVEASYLPQLWRLYRLKRADEFSVLFPFLNIFGRACGVVCSLMLHQSIFGWFFTFGIVLRSCLLLQVVYYRLRSTRILNAMGSAAGAE